MMTVMMMTMVVTMMMMTATLMSHSVSVHAEADSFFCFTNLMAEIRDSFMKSLDETQCGIGKITVDD